MVRGVEVLCGMFVLGRVATADVATGNAGAQVHPCVAGFQTFFAARCAGLDAPDLSQVIAVWHVASQEIMVNP